MGLQLRGGFPSQTLDFATKQYVDTAVALAAPQSGRSSGLNPNVYRLAQITCTGTSAAGVQLRLGRTGSVSDLQGGWAEIDFSALGGGASSTARATVFQFNTPAAGVGTFYILQKSAYVWELWYNPVAGIGDITITQLSGNGVTYFGVDYLNAVGAPTADMQAVTAVSEGATRDWVDALHPRKSIPTSVTGTGASIDANNDAVGVATTSMSVWNVMDFANHNRYRVIWEANTFSAAAYITARFHINGSTDGSSVYNYNRTENNGSTVTAKTTASSVAFLPLGPAGATSAETQAGEFLVHRMDSGSRYVIQFRTGIVITGAAFQQVDGVGDYSPTGTPTPNVTGVNFSTSTGTAKIRVAVYAEW